MIRKIIIQIIFILLLLIAGFFVYQYSVYKIGLSEKSANYNQEKSTDYSGPKEQKKSIKKNSHKRGDSTQNNNKIQQEEQKERKEEQKKNQQFLKKKVDIDIVRITKSRSIIVAGETNPKWDVYVDINGKIEEKIESDEEGKWVYLSRKIEGNSNLVVTIKSYLDDEESAIYYPKEITAFMPQNREGDDEDILVTLSKAGEATNILQKPKSNKNSNYITIDILGDRRLIMSSSFDKKKSCNFEIKVNGKKVRHNVIGKKPYKKWRLETKKKISSEKNKIEISCTEKSGNKVFVENLNINIPNNSADKNDAFKKELVKSKEKGKESKKHEKKIRSLIIVKGDSLWNISKKIYGDGIQYTIIYNANRKKIKDPDLIYPDQVFDLPAIEDAENINR